MLKNVHDFTLLFLWIKSVDEQRLKYQIKTYYNIIMISIN